MRILRYADPDEVHTFDALYTDPSPLIAWARQRIARGSGGMRVLYRPGEGTAAGYVAPSFGGAVIRGAAVGRPQRRGDGAGQLLRGVRLGDEEIIADRSERGQPRSPSMGGSSLRSPRVHRSFHDISTPERKRFFVRRSPSGEIATVYDSPSMVISRLIVRSSFVAMVWSYPRRACRFALDLHNSDAPRGQHVINEPLALLLTNGCAPHYTSRF